MEPTYLAGVKRLLCIHGHFYQPPRENPWIEAVEVQDSAAPFHDWNERIAAECYGPNGAARIKNGGGRIVDIVNNYRHLSFNFGATLLAWMEREAKETYRSILAADRESVKERGHGNAIAQGYNHAILPLSAPRDRRTQVRWGIFDFRRRFGRDPQGFWLPETAVDSETLALLVDEGIRFTVLSPFQCQAVRAPGGPWHDATGARFDPTRPYRVEVRGGRSIAVFFYDGPIARSLAFGEGLAGGDELVRRLESGFDKARGHDELLTVAVDGETFGHHKKGGDEVLAAALESIDARGDVEIVNLGQALDRMPPEWEARVIENSSWSCAHGIERWRSDCGCHANSQPGWNQQWRAPLRAALDDLRSRLGDIFDRDGRKLFLDPWEVREGYIELVMDDERRAAREWLDARAGRRLDENERVLALLLLEMERQSMLMYTSCGWFFSELSGLETVQVLKYAARAIQLALDASGIDLEPRFKELLAKAPSNIPELHDGARIYEQLVKPSVVTMEGVAAHSAIAGLFERDANGGGRIFCYRAQVKQRRRETTGPATLEVSQVALQSLLTQQRLDLSIGVLHLSGSDFRCGLRPYTGGAQHHEIERALFSRLDRLSLAQVVREVDRLFPGRDYTLRDLFIDERRRVAALLLGETLRKYERDYIDIYERNRRLMEFLREIDSPVPGPLRIAAAMALVHQIEEALSDVEAGREEMAEARAQVLRATALARRLQARLDLEDVRKQLIRLVDARVQVLVDTGAEQRARELVEVIDLAEQLNLPLDLWSAQNHIWAATPGACAELDPALCDLLARKLWFDEETLKARARPPAIRSKRAL
jgi:alpha-amylase/alpha-mannosidase (GH57 family)/flagellin-specific chaperone FliS